MAGLNPESLHILRKAFVAKSERNKAYSVRAFARDLEVSAAFVSQLMNGKRGLSLEMALKICQILQFQIQERELFLKALIVKSQKAGKAQDILKETLLFEMQGKDFFDSWVTVEEDKFRFIADWYHLAILDLTFITGFESNVSYISDKLGISTAAAQDAIDRLLRLKLLSSQSGQWTKAEDHIKFPTANSLASIRSFHSQMIGKALDQLQSVDQTDFANREISGTTFAIDSTKVEQARQEILAFQARMTNLFSAGPSDEVYQLNVQFFPLTKKSKRGDA